MDDPPMSQSQPPPTPPAPPRATSDAGAAAAVMVVLVLLCLVLGASLRWGLQQRQARIHMEGRVHTLQSDYGLIVARRSRLGELLLDPRTELIRLNDGNNRRQNQAAILWHAERQMGVLFVDRLAPAAESGHYHLWIGADTEQTMDGGAFHAGAGLTVHEFQLPQRLAPPVQFFVTAETARDAGQPRGDVIFQGG